MPFDKSKNILELEQRTVQMKAIQLIDYSSKFTDLINQPRIEGGKAYYIANITNEPEREDKRGILPNEILPSTAIQEIIPLDKTLMFRDVISEEILSLSLDRVKEFAEDVTSGMYAKASHLIDGEIVAELTNKENYNNKAIFTIEKKYFDKLDEEDNKNNLVNRILSDIDFLLNPSKNNNKAEALTNSKEESSIIWLVDTKIFNLIRRKFLTPMAQTKYGDFIESLRGVIRWPELKNNAAWSLHDYRTVAAPFSIKDYSEWYYGLDKCTYLRLKIAYGLKMLQTTPATLTVMGENKTSETKPLKS